MYNRNNYSLYYLFLDKHNNLRNDEKDAHQPILKNALSIESLSQERRRRLLSCQTTMATIAPNNATKETNIMTDFSDLPVPVVKSTVGSSMLFWDRSCVGNGKVGLFEAVGLGIGAVGICSFLELSKVGLLMGTMVGISSSGNEVDEEGLTVTVAFDPLLDRLLEPAGVDARFVLGI